MLILFPNHPMRGRAIDPDFAEEHAAALALGFECATFDQEKLDSGDATAAIRTLGEVEAAPDCWMRGWMLDAARYAALDRALAAKGFRLIVDAEAYAQAHYLPLAYSLLEGITPESVWTDSSDPDAAWFAYQRLADGDVIVKDWVKSAKHRWEEACFIPARSDRVRVMRTLTALQVDRGSLFERGFVFRRFVSLVTDGRDMRGHPRTDETRLFFLDGKVVVSPRANHALPVDLMAELERRARQFRSRFITIDVAPKTEGEWIIVEAGDAGVSGLPASLMADVFYRALHERLRLGG